MSPYDPGEGDFKTSTDGPSQIGYMPRHGWHFSTIYNRALTVRNKNSVLSRRKVTLPNIIKLILRPKSGNDGHPLLHLRSQEFFILPSLSFTWRRCDQDE